MFILTAIDDSTCARDALALAADIAKRTQGKLLVLHAVEPVPVTPLENPEALRAAMMRAGERFLAESTKHLDVPVTTRLAAAFAADAICEHAAAEHVDLVVMGTHGRGAVARALLGSVAHRVVERTTRPVLVTRGGPVGIERALVAVDGSSDALEAARWFEGLRGALQAKVTLAHVLPVQEEVIDAAPSFGLSREVLDRAIRLETEEALAPARTVFPAEAREGEVKLMGEPARALWERAETGQFDLIVVGRRGEGSPASPRTSRPYWGSASTRLALHARVPVLVVPS